MTEEQKIKNRERAKEHYRKNIEDKRRYAREYHRNNRDKIKERLSNLNEEVKEKNRERSRKHYWENREYKLEVARKYRENNKEKIRERDKDYVKRNPGKLRAIKSKRKKKVRLATPSWLSKEQFNDIEQFYKKAIELEEKTGIPHQVDHIVPIQGKEVCGLHVPWNLQVLTRDENRKKSNKLI